MSRFNCRHGDLSLDAADALSKIRLLEVQESEDSGSVCTRGWYHSFSQQLFSSSSDLDRTSRTAVCLLCVMRIRTVHEEIALQEFFESVVHHGDPNSSIAEFLGCSEPSS